LVFLRSGDINPVYNIYVLYDPRESEHYRYVGCSEGTEERLGEHKWSKDKSPKNDWVLSLKAEGVYPELKTVGVENTEESAWEAEQGFIAKFRAEGTNMIPGVDPSSHKSSFAL
jgi:hypothetical protein